MRLPSEGSSMASPQGMPLSCERSEHDEHETKLPRIVPKHKPGQLLPGASHDTSYYSMRLTLLARSAASSVSRSP